MRKILFIGLGALLLGIIGWIFLFPNQSAPVIEQVQNYLPFGSGDNLPPPENIDGGAFGEFSEENPSATDARSRLFQISKEPVAGATIVSGTSSVFVRYAERATGHIYDFDLYSLQKKRVTNQTVPKVYEAIFSSDGNKVVYRMLEDNISLTITPPRTVGSTTDEFHTLTTTILRKDIDELVLGGNSILLYVLKDDSSVVSSNFEGGSPKTLYSSPFNNWRLGVSNSGPVLWTKSSSNSDGYAYLLNAANSSLSKIAGPIEGLSVNVSPTGKNFFYSYNSSGKIRSFLSIVPIYESFEVLPPTLAEKCAWGNKSTSVIFCGVPNTALSSKEPDDWNRGISHYSDNIWRFHAEYEESEMIAEPFKIAGVDLEVMNPKISPEDDYILFTNRKDLSLWALRIE